MATRKKSVIIPFQEGIAALDRRERERSPPYAALAGAVDAMVAKGDVDGLRILSEVIADCDVKKGSLR